MKRIIAIFLLFFLVLNTLGTIVYHYFNQAIIRAEMKALMNSNLSQNDFEILKIENNSKFFQRIHKKEFRYKGKMYDIIREVHSNNATIYYCINDKKEEQLMDTISKNFDTSDDGISSNKISLRIFKNIFFPTFFEKDKTINQISHFQINFKMTYPKCLFCYYDVDKPPPKVSI